MEDVWTFLNLFLPPNYYTVHILLVLVVEIDTHSKHQWCHGVLARRVDFDFTLHFEDSNSHFMSTKKVADDVPTVHSI